MRAARTPSGSSCVAQLEFESERRAAQTPSQT
jgi:hypothetical protein